MNYPKLVEILSVHNQSHLISHYESLSIPEKETLVKNLIDLDYARCLKIFKNCTAPLPLEAELEVKSKLKPLPDFMKKSLLKSADSDAQVQKWRDIGLSLIREGKVGVILLAGGQGTRLGSDEPKGCFDVGLPSKKSLFQLQGERIASLQKIASGKIAWYVMTSAPTRKSTENFFIEHNFFGLDEKDVFFFNQGVLPAFSPDGKLILASPTELALSPDGNGGIYSALRPTVLKDLERRAIEYVHVADPVFLGASVGHDGTVKTVRKLNPDEAVGIVCLKDGKVGVVEYSEIDVDEANLREGGKLVYDAANIANHVFTTKFLKEIHEFEGEMKYHVANKKITYFDPLTRETVKPSSPNGIKLELFIFDVLPYTKRFTVVESRREEEFSPLKNKNGVDSAETSRRDIIAQHLRYLEAAGATIIPSLDGSRIVEISPLISYDGEGLEGLKDKSIHCPAMINELEMDRLLNRVE